jgi:hypothetical protein
MMARSETFVASPRDTDGPHSVIACAAAAIAILSTLVWAQPQRQLFPLVDSTGLFDGRLLDRQVGIHPFQLGVLGLELSEPLHIGHRGPTVLAAPLGEGWSTDPTGRRHLTSRLKRL